MEENTYQVNCKCKNCGWKGKWTIKKGKSVRVLDTTECPVCENLELIQQPRD